MKVLQTLVLDKYSDTNRYTLVDGNVYKDISGGVGGQMGIAQEPVYCVTLYCELEENEDTQYPLEDFLDKYYVNCTDVMEKKEENGKHIFIFEVEGEALEDIKEISDLVGKRVFHYMDGDDIKFGIE